MGYNKQVGHEACLLGGESGSILYRYELPTILPDVKEVKEIRQLETNLKKSKIIVTETCCGKEIYKLVLIGTVKVEVTYKVLSSTDWTEKAIFEVPFTQSIPIQRPCSKINKKDIKIESLTAFNAPYANFIESKARLIWVSMVWRTCIYE
ncbi:MAG: hypothetical protein ACRDDX_03215 [Cellulosilyticaceae bacterium]